MTALARLGTFIARHPVYWVAGWIVVLGLATPAAQQLPAIARGGSGVLDDSPAQRVNAKLSREFAAPWVDPLALAIASDRYPLGDPRLNSVLACSERTLRAQAQVRDVVPLDNVSGARPGYAALAVALRSADIAEQERIVPRLRDALSPCREQLARLDPAGRFALTGRAAFTVDFNAWNKSSGDRAEVRALPFVLVILLLVFRSVPAAALPLLMGLASTTVALAVAGVLARFSEVSNLTASVITMLGIALGIDYSLLFVSRYRELAASIAPQEAVARALADSGRVIVWSGLTAGTALLGLLWSPLLETRCIGIGGAIVAGVSVLAATTLLPACVALAAPWLDRLRVRLPGPSRAGGLYARVAALVVRRPVATVVVAGALVLGLALPALVARSGYSNDPEFFPARMEARVGGEILAALGHRNDALAIYVLVSATDGRHVLDARHVPALVDFADALRADGRVGRVDSAVTLAAGAGAADYVAFYRDRDAVAARYPAILSQLVTRRGDATLFRVTPADDLTLGGIQALAAGLGHAALRGPFRVEVGGAPSYYNDFDRSLRKSAPAVIVFIVATTLVLLFAAFRSWLIPVKAVLTNLLAVTAAFGIVVAVFQLGWGKGLVGLHAPLEAVPPTVPLMIFCLSFGVSMDYELFLLFRIRGEYVRHGDTSRATVLGVSGAAPVITGAALIMALVFAAFVGGDIQLTKMLGLGLAAAVMIDAVIIRMLLLPAAMTLAGRWNWYPGEASRSEAEGAR